MRIPLTTLLFAAAAAAWQPQAPAADPPKKAYLLFPVRTQLQREFFFDKKERYYLLVHGDSLIDGDGKLDPSRLDFEDLTNDIGRVRILRPGDTIRVELIFAKRPPKAATRLLEFSVLGWSRECGYERHVPGHTIGDSEWKTAVRLTDDVRRLYEEEESEDAVGDESVRVYPVRTALSRLRSDEAECVVSFPQPYGQDATGTLDEKTKARVKELVESLKLKERKRVEFGIRGTLDVNRKAVDRFTDKTARELADDLGFKHYSVVHAWAR